MIFYCCLFNCYFLWYLLALYPEDWASVRAWYDIKRKSIIDHQSSSLSVPLDHNGHLQRGLCWFPMIEDIY